MRNRRLLTALTLSLAVTFVSSAGAAPDGKAIFLAQKCNLCHSIAAAGITQTSDKMKAPDLTGKVKAADSPQLIKFLRKLEPGGEKNKKHAKEFKGTDEEIQAVLDWLVAQKAK
ncbi:MAG TPA: c-type cytochrome [Thermoanaerobaculia bacterium]|nr:c-type cytochrome [Thermoanaerobaculia bacterium]